jgi:hypothetical protein
MTNEILALTLVAAVLTGLERLLSSDVSWFPTLTGGWRAIAASACAVPVYLFDLVIGGSDWQSAAWKTAATVGVPLLLSVLTMLGKPAVDAAKAAACFLLLAAALYSATACVKVVGPLSPQDLPPSLICVEFLIGDPPAVDGAVCAGTAQELATLEQRYLADHPKTLAVRLVRK